MRADTGEVSARILRFFPGREKVVRFACALVTLTVAALRLLQAALIARALASWVIADKDGKVVKVLWTVTEPVLMPFRALLSKFSFARNCPIDLSFLTAFLTLTLIIETLPAIAF